VASSFCFQSLFSTFISAINASQLQVKFNQEVLESDLIDGSGALQNLTVTQETVDGVLASNPGTLTPTLSSDGKTLTLTTAAGSKFDGTYTVKIAKDTVKVVKNGSFVAAYEGKVVVNDTTRPTLKGVTYNAAGTKALLEFSEPVATLDTDFDVVDMVRADGVALDSATSTGITSADFTNSVSARNVVEFDLTDINAADANKAINLKLVGVKDEAGNLISPNPVSFSVTKDTTIKAQASITSIKRTSLTNLQITFDKELQTAPTGVTIDGVASGAITTTSDAKVINVALDAAASPNQQTLTGIHNVAVTGFNAYNTSGAATTVTKIADFTIDKTAPTIVSTSLAKVGGVDYLVVNFNKEVTSADLAAGTFTGTVLKPNGDLDVTGTVNFTAPTFYNAPLTATTSKSVKINLSTLTDSLGAAYTFGPGNYTLSISAGLSKDGFGNATAAKNGVVLNIATSTAKLPAPTAVASKVGDPSTVVVTFGNKVDVATAQTASNYSIEGATITAAKVVTNTASGATVELSVASGSVNFTGVRQVTINNVKGYADSYAAMDTYTAVKTFTENVAPTLKAAKLTATNKIELSFSEALVDSSAGNDFDVYQNGVKVGSASALDSDTTKVVITLTNPVASTSGLVVKAASTIDLTDGNLNDVVFNDTSVSY
jgi:hypothetical protein